MKNINRQVNKSIIDNYNIFITVKIIDQKLYYRYTNSYGCGENLASNDRGITNDVVDTVPAKIRCPQLLLGIIPGITTPCGTHIYHTLSYPHAPHPFTLSYDIKL